MNDNTNEKDNRTIMRFSTGPEYLHIGGSHYLPESANATTYMILGDVVVHSREFHVTIISGLKAMKNAGDFKTAKKYNINFSTTLSQASLDCFNETWVGALGVVRANNKAGRLWKDVGTDNGEQISFLAFWANAKSVAPTDLDLLRDTFDLNTEVFVEYVDRKSTKVLPARGG